MRRFFRLPVFGKSHPGKRVFRFFCPFCHKHVTAQARKALICKGLRSLVCHRECRRQGAHTLAVASDTFFQDDHRPGKMVFPLLKSGAGPRKLSLSTTGFFNRVLLFFVYCLGNCPSFLPQQEVFSPNLRENSPTTAIDCGVTVHWRQSARKWNARNTDNKLYFFDRPL